MKNQKALYNITECIAYRLKASKDIDIENVYKDQLRKSLELITNEYRFGTINSKQFSLLYRATDKAFTKYMK